MEADPIADSERRGMTVNFPDVLQTGFFCFLGILVIALLLRLWTEISFWLFHLVKSLFGRIRRSINRHMKAPGC